jgi:hypothetical protein
MLVKPSTWIAATSAASATATQGQNAWTKSTLYSFKGLPTDIGNPVSNPIFGLGGALYGGTSTINVGTSAIYKLQ